MLPTIVYFCFNSCTHQILPLSSKLLQSFQSTRILLDKLILNKLIMFESASQLVNKLRGFWEPDHTGVARPSSKAPKWIHVRNDMQSAFPSYYEESHDEFAKDVGHAIKELNKMKPGRDGPAYLGDDPREPNYKDVVKATMDEDYGNLKKVIRESVELFNGMPNWAHPMSMCNVIPPGNKAGIIGAMMANTFCPNIIEGEYAWNVMRAEMESAAMLAKIIGWDTEKAGGLYTYGGSGCYLYGMKYALTHVLGQDSRCYGIRTNGKLLVSQQGHYCMMNSTDWTGLGMENIVKVETNDDTNAMDLIDLEKKIKEIQAAGDPVISVVCTMGTTDAFAIDPVAEVRKIIDRNPNPKGFGKPFLYCDAVIGWSWIMFNDYDFDENPLGFEDAIIPIIKSNNKKIADIKYADAVGTDFHKTGWAPYNCSLFMMQDLNHFRDLMNRPGSAYLQERTCYNPGLFTMEVSRSGSYAMAGWATLKFLGRDGFMSVLGGILHVEKYLRDRISEENDMVCANDDDHGFVTLIRVYKPDVKDGNKLYETELSDPDELDTVNDNNILQENIANTLWEWFRSGKKVDGLYGPYTSYTSGFRPTDYNDDFIADNGVIYAIKAFPMNVNVTVETMETLIKQIRIARDIVLGERAKTWTPPKSFERCPLPYSKITATVPCAEGTDGESTGKESQIRTLLSGIGSKVHGSKAKKGCCCKD